MTREVVSGVPPEPLSEERGPLTGYIGSSPSVQEVCEQHRRRVVELEETIAAQATRLAMQANTIAQLRRQVAQYRDMNQGTSSHELEAARGRR